MAFRTDKVIFYHIPKTGGRWVKAAMIYAGVPYRRAKYYYGTDRKPPKELVKAHALRLKREHETPLGVLNEDKDKLFSFTFVRRPLTWYKSFWAHRMLADGIEGRMRMTNSFPLDWIWDGNFEKFIANVLRKYPDGFLTDVFRLYVGKDGKALDFIGKQENLREDLIRALTLAGETFDKKKIMKVKRVNISSGSIFFTKNNLLDINDHLAKELDENEKWIIDTFYN